MAPSETPDKPTTQSRSSKIKGDDTGSQPGKSKASAPKDDAHWPRTRCPECGKKVKGRPEKAGKSVTCPGCKAKVQLPVLATDAPPSAATAPTTDKPDDPPPLDQPPIGEHELPPEPATLVAADEDDTHAADSAPPSQNVPDKPKAAATGFDQDLDEESEVDQADPSSDLGAPNPADEQVRPSEMFLDIMQDDEEMQNSFVDMGQARQKPDSALFHGAGPPNMGSNAELDENLKELPGAEEESDSASSVGDLAGAIPEPGPTFGGRSDDDKHGQAQELARQRQMDTVKTVSMVQEPKPINTYMSEAPLTIFQWIVVGGLIFVGIAAVVILILGSIQIMS